MGSGRGLGIWVGGALFHCQSPGPAKTTDSIYHLSIKYPHPEGWQAQGSSSSAPTWLQEAHSLGEEGHGPRHPTTALSRDLALSICFQNQPLSHLLDLRLALLGSCPSQPHSSPSLHGTRNPGRCRRNQNSAGPATGQGHPSGELAVLMVGAAGTERRAVCLQGRENEEGRPVPEASGMGGTGRGAGLCPARWWVSLCRGCEGWKGPGSPATRLTCCLPAADQLQTLPSEPPGARRTGPRSCSGHSRAVGVAPSPLPAMSSDARSP